MRFFSQVLRGFLSNSCWAFSKGLRLIRTVVVRVRVRACVCVRERERGMQRRRLRPAFVCRLSLLRLLLACALGTIVLAALLASHVFPSPKVHLPKAIFLVLIDLFLSVFLSFGWCYLSLYCWWGFVISCFGGAMGKMVDVSWRFLFLAWVVLYRMEKCDWLSWSSWIPPFLDWGWINFHIFSVFLKWVSPFGLLLLRWRKCIKMDAFYFGHFFFFFFIIS